MRHSALILAFLAPLAAALAGCESKQDSGTVVGGIVGNEIGRQLDVRDRQLAQQAEMDAWERGPPGRPVRWRNPDNGRYGEVVAEDYYDRGGVRCRDFIHRVWIDGRPQQMRGTACRNPDGTWSQVA